MYTNDLGTEIEETEIPEEYRELAEEWREKLVEAVAETDEELTLKYLEGEEITEAELKEGIRRATVNVEFYQYYVAQHLRTKGFNYYWTLFLITCHHR